MQFLTICFAKYSLQIKYHTGICHFHSVAVIPLNVILMTQLLYNVHVYKNNFQRNLSFTVKSLGGHILSRASLTRTVDVTILGAAFLIFLTDRQNVHQSACHHWHNIKL